MRQKWDAKAKMGIFIGYSEELKGYRIWLEEQNKVEIHRDVFFKIETTSTVTTQKGGKVEKLTGVKEIEEEKEEEKKPENSDETLEESDDQEEEEEENESINGDESQRRSELVGDLEQDQEEPEQAQLNRRLRDRQIIKPPKRYTDYVWENVNELLIADSNEPQSYKEALESFEAEKWKVAMREEMDSLKQNET